MRAYCHNRQTAWGSRYADVRRAADDKTGLSDVAVRQWGNQNKFPGMGTDGGVKEQDVLDVEGGYVSSLLGVWGTSSAPQCRDGNGSIINGSRVMGQMGHHFWMGRVGHGSQPVTHGPMMK